MNLIEKNWWNKTWNSVLVRLGIRRVPGVLNSLGDTLYGLSITGGETTADMTLYVDGTLGNDSNSGLVGFPLKTIQAALNRIPKTVMHNITINVAAGTYAENLLIDLNVKDLKAFTIQGSSWTAVTPATGPASGTFTSNNGINQLALAGATWTINNLKGVMLKITSGAKSGNYYPIASNTATTIDVGGDASAIGNASFEFAVPAAIITKGAGSTTSMIITGYGVGSSASAKFFVRNLNIGQTAAVSLKAEILNSTVGVYNCLLTAAPTFDGVLGAQLYNCYVNGGAIVCNMLRGGGSLVDCVLNGNTSTYGLLATVLSLSITGGLIIQGVSSGAGMALNNGATNISFGSNCKVQIRNNSVGISVNGASSGGAHHIVATSTSTIIISNNTTNGIAVAEGGNLRLASCGGVFSITSNTGSGIVCSSTGNSIHIGGASSITGNGSWGINLSAATTGTYNEFIAGSSVTMNTNTAGDLTLDGTNPITIAELRAAPQKTMVDVNRLNRLAAD